MKKIFPFLIIGGLAAWFFISARNLSQNIKFVIRRISFGGTFLQPKIFITLAAQNPTNAGATVKSIVASINYKGNTFADVSSFQVQNIRPQSENMIVLTAQPSAIGIFSTVRNIIQDKKFVNDIAIVGTANIDGVNVPINLQYGI
jgi:hypothetical protein